MVIVIPRFLMPIQVVAGFRVLTPHAAAFPIAVYAHFVRIVSDNSGRRVFRTFVFTLEGMN